MIRWISNSRVSLQRLGFCKLAVAQLNWTVLGNPDKLNLHMLKTALDEVSGAQNSITGEAMELFAGPLFEGQV